jgi:hypothetical protein
MLHELAAAAATAGGSGADLLRGHKGGNQRPTSGQFAAKHGKHAVKHAVKHGNQAVKHAVKLAIMLPSMAANQRLGSGHTRIKTRSSQKENSSPNGSQKEKAANSSYSAASW